MGKCVDVDIASRHPRGASEVGLRTAGQVSVQPDPGIRVIAGIIAASHFLYAGIVRESHLLGIGSSIVSNNQLYTHMQTNSNPMATQGAPKWAKCCPMGPKGTPLSGQGNDLF